MPTALSVIRLLILSVQLKPRTGLQGIDMTKPEARKIATAMNAWRRDTLGLMSMPHTATEFGLALDALTQPGTMTENIRNAAIHWPQLLSDVESEIAYVFCEAREWPKFDSNEGRTYMLFVAEALES